MQASKNVSWPRHAHPWRRHTAVFEIFIKTTPERLWEAITDPVQRARYSFGVQVRVHYAPGSAYQSVAGPGIAIAAGENLVVDPPRLLVQSFTALWSDDVKAQGTTRVTWEIEPVGTPAALTVIHDQLPEGANAELYGGWPMILSGLNADRDGRAPRYARLAPLFPLMPGRVSTGTRGPRGPAREAGADARPWWRN